MLSVIGCERGKIEKDTELKKLILQTLTGKVIPVQSEFNPGITSYTAIVSEEIKEIKVIAEAKGKNAEIEGAGTHKLAEEGKLISITVTAESGDKKEYIINILKKKNITLDEYVDKSVNYNYTRSTFPLGANIFHPADWSRANIFVDLIKQVEFFGTADKPWEKGVIKCDENSWPTEDFGVILFRDPYSLGNVGTYKISFYCSTMPAITTNASSGEVINMNRDSKTGKVTADLVTTAKQDQLFLSFRNTNGGVRNLKVIRPGCTENETFTKEFLDHIERFSMIRTMETVLTNNSEETVWSERQKPMDGSYAEKKRRGVAWEYCIELANTSKSDLWINVPHMADADYIRNLAQLIKKQLNPELNVYVEYSNEVWNWMFTQSHWVLDAASKAPYVTKLSYDGETTPGYLHWRLIGEKLKECSDIFGEVFGKEEINKRVRPVLAGQIAYQITLDEPLKYLAHTYGEPRNYIYGIAGAGYFNMGEEKLAQSSVTVDEIIEGFNENIDNVVSVYVENMKSFALEYGLKMLQYEGGPDTYGPGSGSLAEKEASQKDPRIKDLIIKYLENWYYAGGDMFCWYAAGPSAWDSQYGSFGLINIPGEDVGPKVEAVDAIIAGGMEKYAGGQIPTDNPKMDTNGNTDKVDFEEYADIGPGEALGNATTSGAYYFSCSSQLTTIKDMDWAENFNSIVLHGRNWGGEMKMSRVDKKPFSLKKVRILRPFNIEQASSVKITGYYHTRGSVEMVVNLPLESGRNGVILDLPEAWTTIGMNELKFEFRELPDWKGEARFGAIDDLEIYNTVLE